MNPLTDLIDRYFAAWNDTDDARRRDLIARTWTDDAAYLDPLVRGDGHDGIDAMTSAVQAQFPVLRFRRDDAEIDAHHDRVRFGWELGLENAPALAGGVDFGIVAPDGRLRQITGFLDFAPQTAG